MAARMVAALEAANQNVPVYLQQIVDQSGATQTATFAMHCYWVGEGNLGRIEGVTNTHSAWLGGLEVVEVIYDPELVTYEKLIETAQSMECASKVFAHNDQQLETAKALVGDRATEAPGAARAAKLSDQKYYLRNTAGVRSLPLSKLQSTKINARLGQRKGFDDLLSPRQSTMLTKINEKLRTAPRSLNGFVFPEDDSQLTDYEAKLIELLLDANQ